MPAKFVGLTLLVFAAIHLVVGLLLFGDWMWLIVGGGVGNLDWTAQKLAAFWFLIFAWPAALLGHAVHWAFQHTGQLPPSLGWWIMGVPALSLIFLPASGLWLFALLGLSMLVRKTDRLA